MVVDSRRIVFSPGRVKPGNYFFDVGTAGSVTLILQALLLPLARATGPSRIKLKGGTHVPWSPPYHYLAEVFLPTIALMGIKTAVRLGKWGWYPKGGGEVEMDIHPTERLSPPGARSTLGTRRSESPVRLLPSPRTHPGKRKEADRGPLAERQVQDPLRTFRKGLPSGREIWSLSRPGRGRPRPGFHPWGPGGNRRSRWRRRRSTPFYLFWIQAPRWMNI